MLIEDTTKVVLLPKNERSFQIFSLKFGSTEKQILYSGEGVYELRLITGQNDYVSRPEPKLTNGEAVKSLIIENSANSEEGAVLSCPNIVNSTKLNLAYFVILVMWHKKELYGGRYHAMDDILDNFSAYVKPQKLLQDIRPHLVKLIESLCQVVEEGGEPFYKFSTEKAMKFVSTKIDSLADLLHSSPDYALTGFIRNKLNAYEEAPDEIFRLQIKKYAVEYIFGSYLTQEIKHDFMREASLDFSTVENYMKAQEEKQKALAVVESNMNSVVQTTKKARESLAKITKTTKSSKKVVKKVAVGKGALDGFFSRA